MKHDDDGFTDALLSEALGYADPSEQDIARNLASVEQRLGIAGGGGTGAERQSTGSRRTGRQGVRSISQPARAVRSGTSATAVGRWLAISAVGALIGYLGGRAESQRELAQLDRQTQEQAQLLERQETRLQEAEREIQQAARQQAARQQASAEREQQTSQREAALQEESSEPAQTADELHAFGRPQKPVAPTRASHPTRTPRAPRLLREAQPSAASTASGAPRANQELRRAIELLQRAEAQLRAGDAFAASLLLSDLDRSVPQDLLREERLVTRALVGCALGEVAPARAALHELDQLDAQSIYRARLEGSCAEKNETSAPKAAASPH
jgi:hypothetical protein